MPRRFSRESKFEEECHRPPDMYRQAMVTSTPSLHIHFAEPSRLRAQMCRMPLMMMSLIAQTADQSQRRHYAISSATGMMPCRDDEDARHATLMRAMMRADGAHENSDISRISRRAVYDISRASSPNRHDFVSRNKKPRQHAYYYIFTAGIGYA